GAGSAGGDGGRGGRGGRPGRWAPGPGPFGLATMLQAVPFQCSVSVWNTVPALVEIWKSPTAQTSLAEMAVTPLRWLFSVPSLGLGTIAQFLPFQCSMNVWATKPEMIDPTAQTSLLATAAIPETPPVV